MKSIHDLKKKFNISNRNPIIASVLVDYTSWGIRGTSCRQQHKYQFFLDHKDNHDRFIFTIVCTLNLKKTGIQKGSDVRIEVSHYSNFSNEKRGFTVHEGEHHIRLCSDNEDVQLDSFFSSIRDEIEAMDFEERYSNASYLNYKAKWAA